MNKSAYSYSFTGLFFYSKTSALECNQDIIETETLYTAVPDLIFRIA